jgi:hypothetical protein
MVQRLNMGNAVTRKRILSEISQRTPGFCCQGKLGMFLDCYFVAEVLARKNISFYQDDIGKTHSKNWSISQLNATISHFGLVFSKNDIRTLFLGGEGLRGIKTARQLRNGYLHSLSFEDRSEIESNASALITLLERFIVAIGG